MENLSKCLIAALTLWIFDKHDEIKTQFDFSKLRLLTLMNTWDHINVSEIKK